MLKEKYISEAQMKEEPKKKLVLKIKEGSITPEHFNKREVDEYLISVVGSVEDTGMLPEDKAKLDALPTAAELQNTLNGKQNSLTFDSAPTENSANPVYSGGIKSYVDNHIPQTDATPTQGSNNPVSSNGVYQAIQAIDVSSQISGKADKSEMSVVAGTGANADKTTITLKNGTSATVLTQHQDVSGFIKEGEVFGTGDDYTASFNPYSDTVWNKQQTLSEIQKQQIRENIGAGAADNEDIQNVSGELKFADKAYNTSAHSGLGRKYLRKNIIDGKNVLTQAMVNTANTIYHIQYDYDLNGQAITLPAGCVLEFDGGSVKNGTLNFSDTVIKAKGMCFDLDLLLEGRVFNSYFDISWFITDDTTDYTPLVKKAVEVANTIKFHAGEYCFSECHIIKSDISIIGEEDAEMSSSIIFKAYQANQRYLFKVGGLESTFGELGTKVRKFRLSGIAFRGEASKPLLSASDSIYKCGYLCLDRVEIGTINCSFSGMNNAPALFIGAGTYEINIPFISIYNTRTKSNCPAIYFFSKSQSDCSAMHIGTLMAELLCGPIMSMGGNITISECIIDSLYFEGSMNVAEPSIVSDGSIKYGLSNAFERIIEYKSENHVYLFDLSNGFSLSINNVFINNIGDYWANNIDSSDLHYTHGFFSCSSLNMTSGVAINTISCFQAPYIFINNSSNIVDIHIKDVITFGYNSVAGNKETIILTTKPCDLPDDLFVFPCSILPYSISEATPQYLGHYFKENNLPTIVNKEIVIGSAIDYIFYKPFSLLHDSLLSLLTRIREVIYYVDYYDASTMDVIQTKQYYFNNQDNTNYKYNIIPLNYIENTFIRIRRTTGSPQYIKELRLSKSATLYTPTFKANTCIGEVCFDESEKKPKYWSGNTWLDATGFTIAPRKGTTAERPTNILTTADAGYQYFDTELGMPIYLKVTGSTKSWVKADGTDA